MSKKDIGNKNSKEANTGEQQSLRQAWISRDKGNQAMMLVSATLAIYVVWQSVSGGSSIWQGILRGVVLGGSLWLVFFGMNYFHGLFGKPEEKKKEK